MFKKYKVVSSYLHVIENFELKELEKTAESCIYGQMTASQLNEDLTDKGKKTLVKMIYNNNRYTVFHMLCCSEPLQIELIKFFLDNGADVTAKTNDNTTPLHLLCDNSELTYEILQLFVQKNVNINETDFYQKTAFHYLCRNSAVSIEMLELFIKAKCDINAQDQQKRTPFHFLCQNERISVDLIRFFIVNKGFHNKDDNNHNTPLHYLSMNKNISEELLSVFIEQKIEIEQLFYGKPSPLLYLCLNEHIKIDLLEWAFDKFKVYKNPNYEGKTLLHEWCENSKNVTYTKPKEDILKFLLDKIGCTKDNNDKTPFELVLDICEKKINYEIAGRFICLFPANQIIIVDNIKHQEKLRELIDSKQFQQSFRLSPLAQKKEIFFRLLIKRWNTSNKGHHIPKVLVNLILGYILTPQYIFDVSKKSHQQLFDNAKNRKTLILAQLEKLTSKERKKLVRMKDDNAKTILHHICEKSEFHSNNNLNFENIDFLVTNGADITAQDMQSKTPPHYFCKQQDKTRIEILFLKNNNQFAFTQDNEGKTPLHYRCNSDVNVNFVDILKEYINKDVFHHQKDKSGNSPLHYLFDKDRFHHKNNGSLTAIFNFIIDNNLLNNVQNNRGDTLLHLLSDKAITPAMITALYNKGFNLNEVNKDGKTALHIMCKKNQRIEVIKCLLNHVDLSDKQDNSGNTALHYLLFEESADIEKISLLLDHAADPLLENQHQFSPLDIICKAEHHTIRWLFLKTLCMRQTINIEAINILIKNKINLNEKDTNGKTLLHYVWEHHADNIKVIKYLIENKAKPNFADNDNKTPLHYLCENTYADKNARLLLLKNLCVTKQIYTTSIDILIKNKIDLNEKDTDGKTLLHYLFENNILNDDILETLLLKEANLNVADKSGQTPLHYLFESNSINDGVLELLLLKETNLNLADKSGQTPLHYLCNNMKITKEMLEFFFNKKAAFDLKDTSGKTPLQILENSNLCPKSKKELIELFNKLSVLSSKSQSNQATSFNSPRSFGNSPIIMLNNNNQQLNPNDNIPIIPVKNSDDLNHSFN